MDLDQKVHFLGSVTRRELKYYYNSSDVCVLPSYYESFGLSALEAAACGVPVIATNKGGIPEVVEHGKSGFLSDVGDFKDMSNNALHILNNEKVHNEFKLHALSDAKKFDIHQILPLYENIYAKSIENSI